jgi:transposase-like protein
MKTYIKFETTTEKYEDIEKQLQQMEEIPNCPECKAELIKITRTEEGHDYECPKCHKKFELLKMEIKLDKHGNMQRHYKLRGEQHIIN